MKDQILKLRDEGKSYREIKRILGCSSSTIAYHCGEGQKEKTQNRLRKRRKNDPIQVKIESFKDVQAYPSKRKLYDKVRDYRRPEKYNVIGEQVVEKFSKNEVLAKFGDNPICYLTGRPIDFNKPRTYSLDHVVPVSKGGQFTLANMGLTCKEANKAKDDLAIEELLKLCVDILTHNGYNVEKN